MNKNIGEGGLAIVSAVFKKGTYSVKEETNELNEDNCLFSMLIDILFISLEMPPKKWCLNLSSRNFMAFLTDGISEDSERN
jgi:hypothetical protein